jgi:hypothetical protein
MKTAKSSQPELRREREIIFDALIIEAITQ